MFEEEKMEKQYFPGNMNRGIRLVHSFSWCVKVQSTQQVSSCILQIPEYRCTCVTNQNAGKKCIKSVHSGHQRATLQNVGVLKYKALVCVFKQSFISTKHSHYFLTAGDKSHCSAKVSNENREKGSDKDGKKKKKRCGR